MDKKELVIAIGANFRTFGGSRPHGGNPIAAAMEGKPLEFAAGVSVDQVVDFVINNLTGLKPLDYTFGEFMGREAHVTELQLHTYYEALEMLKEGALKFLKQVIGTDTFTLGYDTQEGDRITIVGPDVVGFQGSNDTWNLDNLGIENILGITNAILEKEAKPTTSLIDVMERLFDDRTYSLTVDGIPAAILSKGEDMPGRLRLLLLDQYAADELCITGMKKGKDNSHDISLTYTRDGKAGEDTVNLRVVPVF